MCEFCENKVDMGNKPIEDRYGIDLLIDGEFIYAWCECGIKVVKEINFCPMCGRDLGAKRMSDLMRALIKSLIANGVKVPADEPVCLGGEKVSPAYNLDAIILDFSEHDKVFEDKIAKLESEISYLRNTVTQYKEDCVKLEKELESKGKINLNDRIKVKLTPLGAEIYYHQYDELNKRIKENGGTELEPIMPRIDKDGYTEFQLWYFMELYGEHIGMCKKNVIEPLDIIITE